MKFPPYTLFILPTRFINGYPDHYAVFLNKAQFKGLKIEGFELVKTKQWLVDATVKDLHKELTGNKIIRIVYKEIEENSVRKRKLPKTLYYIVSSTLYASI